LALQFGFAAEEDRLRAASPRLKLMKSVGYQRVEERMNPARTL
jgi:hypothetical protein